LLIHELSARRLPAPKPPPKPRPAPAGQPPSGGSPRRE
jgi:hypothetical protein